MRATGPGYRGENSDFGGTESPPKTLKGQFPGWPFGFR
jgi:hypothetical protein